MKKAIVTLLTSVLLTLPLSNSVYANPLFEITVVHENGDIEIPRTTKTLPTFTDSEILALQQIAIAEAGNQGPEGMAYVMQTIINRISDNRFPNDVISVIEEKGQFSTASYYYKCEINEESVEAYDMLYNLENKGQLFFEITNSNSWQSKNLKLCFTYKSHTFYM